MSTEQFRVVEHTIPCQHVREYRRATKSQDDEVLQLAIKQYIPRDAAANDPDAVTIIGGHANGFPKEMYEPVWDELLKASKQHGFSIRGIWIADNANQGASSVLNQDVQGDDPSYFDHARDLLAMVNTFRSEIRRPIVGIGHSIGGTELVLLSVMHPRLFSSLVLLEPMIQEDVPAGPNASMGSTLRADAWPSRDDAAAAFRKSKFFSALDPRVLQALITHGLRPTPTPAHPDPGRVTLTTPKLQEVWSYLRPNFAPLSPGGPTRADRLLHPDEDYAWQWQYLFYRPEMAQTFAQLPLVRPPVLYAFGSRSWMGTPDMIAAKTSRTGTGLGGSGGEAAGAVATHVFPKWGHVFPLEHPAETAALAAAYVGPALRQWREDETFLANHDPGRTDASGHAPSKRWLENVRKPGRERRPAADKGKL